MGDQSAPPAGDAARSRSELIAALPTVRRLIIDRARLDIGLPSGTSATITLAVIAEGVSPAKRPRWTSPRSTDPHSSP